MGVDPAEASLEVAQSKDQTGQITWVHGDAATAPALGADLALMTGNVAQVLLTDDDWTRTPKPSIPHSGHGATSLSRPGVQFVGLGGMGG
jgi:hypothetical protein